MSIAIVTATQCAGLLLIFEKMFESRLFFVDKLIGMGARIVLCDPAPRGDRGAVAAPRRDGRVARHPGRDGDAARGARRRGQSIIHNIGQIERGYEHIDDRLNALGAVDRASRGVIETAVAGPVPRYELAGWREELRHRGRDHRPG